MTNKIKILSTTSLEGSLIEKANEKGIYLETFDFIKRISLLDDVLKDEIKQILQSPSNIIFTSAFAIETLSPIISPNNNIKIFCIGKATKKAVLKYFDASCIAAWANDAQELAKLIIDANINDAVYFCGTQRLDTLPTKLHEAHIRLWEIVIYETIEEPCKIDSFFDGILFFSPSCASSFFSINKVSDETVFFAIGNTTAYALLQKANNPVVVCKTPKKETVLTEAIEHLTKQLILK